MWQNNVRSVIFKSRFYAYLATFSLHFQIPRNFTFYKPGLEIKLACEEAEKSGAKIHFLGPEFDQVTW